MCRHLGYLGPPVAIGEILTRGPHSLRTQSWAPRDMRGGGTINADGFGVAWWVPAPIAAEGHGAGVTWSGGHAPDVLDAARAEAERTPTYRESASGSVQSSEVAGAGPGLVDMGAGRGTVDSGAAAEEGPGPVAPGQAAGGGRAAAGALVASRYRNAEPIWVDPAVDEVLPQIRSRAVLAAIRSATVGLPVERAACAPFTHGPWAFSHNGAIPDWRTVLTALAAKFDSPSVLEAESLTDSAVLWVILRGLLETAEVDTASALRQIVAAVLEHAPTARLNLLLSDGENLWATTWYHSLSVLVTDTFAVISSEPYDDDERWRSIADRQLVVAGPGRVTVEPLDIETGRATS